MQVGVHVIRQQILKHLQLLHVLDQGIALRRRSVLAVQAQDFLDLGKVAVLGILLDGAELGGEAGLSAVQTDRTGLDADELFVIFYHLGLQRLQRSCLRVYL